MGKKASNPPPPDISVRPPPPPPPPPLCRVICNVCGTLQPPYKHTSWPCRFFEWIDGR